MSGRAPAHPGRVAFLGALIAVGYLGGRWLVYSRFPVRREAGAAELEGLDERVDARLFEEEGIHWKGGAVWVPPGRYVDQFTMREAARTASRIREDLAHPFDWSLWFRRDLVMSVPRLAALALCLLAALLDGGLRCWGWRWGAPWTALGVLGLLLGGELLRFAGCASGVSFSVPQAAVGWLATVPVALFEEAAFRGLVFAGLARAWGPCRAAVASSAFFMVWHYGAQGYTAWPSIFLFGMGACGAYQAGAGLPVLAAVHEAVDGAWYSFGADSRLPYAHPFLARLGPAVMLGAAAWSWVLLRRSSPDEAEKAC